MHKLTYLEHRPGHGRAARHVQTRACPTPDKLRATHAEAPEGDCDRLSKALASASEQAPLADARSVQSGSSRPSTPAADSAEAEPSPPPTADGSLTKLYIDVMHAAVRRSDDWGSWALMGESLRGIGVMAMVGAPVGLPCALVADAARLGGRWWRALRRPA